MCTINGMTFRAPAYIILNIDINNCFIIIIMLADVHKRDVVDSEDSCMEGEMRL